MKMTEKAYRKLHPRVRSRVEDAMQNSYTVDGVTFDKSGKDISHIVSMSPKMTDLTPRQARGLVDNSDVNRHAIENGKFVFAFFKQAHTMIQRFPSLNKQDIARLMFIGSYTAWETGRLQLTRGKVLTKPELEKLLEMSTKRFREYFKKLEGEGIIREEESGEIFMNELVFYRGAIKDLGEAHAEYTYTLMYRDTVRDLYQQFKGRRLGQLANIYEILPFLNFDTNMVCHNPEETDTDLLKPMNLREISEILGYEDASKLKRALNPIKIDGVPVFWTPESVHSKKERIIIVNPRIIFKGDGETLRGIKAMFN